MKTRAENGTNKTIFLVAILTLQGIVVGLGIAVLVAKCAANSLLPALAEEDEPPF